MRETLQDALFPYLPYIPVLMGVFAAVWGIVAGLTKSLPTGFLIILCHAVVGAALFSMTIEAWPTLLVINCVVSVVFMFGTKWFRRDKK